MQASSSSEWGNTILGRAGYTGTQARHALPTGYRLTRSAADSSVNAIDDFFADIGHSTRVAFNF